MENLSEVSEDTTFNSLKYKRYTSTGLYVGSTWVPPSTYWVNDKGQLHRDDGPAIEYEDGSKLWYQHGKLHREDGPAVEHVDGTKGWYQHGFWYEGD